MTSTLQNPRVRNVLDSMHAESQRIDPPLLAKAKGKTQEERTALLGDAFIPVDAEAGRLLYTLARGCAPGTSRSHSERAKIPAAAARADLTVWTKRCPVRRTRNDTPADDKNCQAVA